MGSTLTRRSFLLASGAAAALALVRLRSARAEAAAGAAGAPRAAAPVAYGGHADVYRRRWTWDRVVKGTHYANCGYQRCAWNVYVKDGVVWREEQVAAYPQTRPDLPDFNPRGCQKGACYSDRMVDASRLSVPLRRVGARGEGRWKRVSWDEALTAIARHHDVSTSVGRKPSRRARGSRRSRSRSPAHGARGRRRARSSPCRASRATCGPTRRQRLEDLRSMPDELGRGALEPCQLRCTFARRAQAARSEHAGARAQRPGLADTHGSTREHACTGHRDPIEPRALAPHHDRRRDGRATRVDAHVDGAARLSDERRKPHRVVGQLHARPLLARAERGRRRVDARHLPRPIERTRPSPLGIAASYTSTTS